MCGITLALSAEHPIDAAKFEAATLTLRHRGGDGEGTEVLDAVRDGVSVALGHCRLSIFDLSPSGRQPMQGAGSRWIVFNGSIFNWYELRSELASAGYSFRTGTDTEVILAAYDRWGERCVEKFNGFWAFVIVSPQPSTGRTELFLSRDRLGIKPLYFTQRGAQWFFASELCAIWRYFDEQPVLDMRQGHRFLIHDLSHDSAATLYAGVSELEPGCSAVLRSPYDRLQIRRYWQLQDTAESALSEGAALDRFSELIEDAVRLRLRADREVALTLSGGIDSSVLAVAAARVSARSVTAFTSRFPSCSDIDETRYASAVARKLDIDHRVVNCESFDLRAEERRLTQRQELMYTSFSVLVNWLVLQRIRDCGTRIFLTGQGGDELLLGYERYYSAFVCHGFSQDFRSGCNAVVLAARNSKLSLPSVLAYAWYFGGTALRKRRYLQEARELYREEFVTAFDSAPATVSMNLRELQRAEITGSQLRRLLRYDDRTAGAFGLEGRPAFLDHRVVELCYSLPWQLKIRDGWTKYLARKYLERHGLPEIAWRRHKLGYAAPTLEWAGQLLPNFADCIDIPAVRRLLRRDLSLRKLAPRAHFKALNLLSTAKILGWA